ncbi:MAG TPA: DNA polymerase III subunit delta [Candidatus Pullichristensenella avicola]|nr:DNA polymerase III subunit delta [Candidatus Pullichristensenella avicola]
MTWKEFYAQIKEGALEGVYLFAGPEEYVKREALEALARAILPEGMEALNRADLEGASAAQIIDAAETLPLLCARRLVIVRDWAPLCPGKARGEDDEAARMIAYLDRAPESCIVVFYMRGEADGRKKLTSALKKRGAEVRFEALTDAEILRWANAQLKPLGKSISQQAASHLAFTAGRDLTRLCAEIDKLADYIGARKEIQVDDIEAVVSPSLEFSVFEMLDFLFAGDLTRAERSLNVLLRDGQNCVGILAMLVRQLRMLTHLALCQRAGGNAASVEKALKLHPYAAKRAARQARQMDADELSRLYTQAVDADFAIKSGRLRDSEALQFFMLQIASRGTKRSV